MTAPITTSVDVFISAADGVTINARFPRELIDSWPSERYRALMEAAGVLADLGIAPGIAGPLPTEAEPPPPTEPEPDPTKADHDREPAPAEVLCEYIQDSGRGAISEMTSRELIETLSHDLEMDRDQVLQAIRDAVANGWATITLGRPSAPRQISLTEGWAP